MYRSEKKFLNFFSYFHFDKDSNPCLEVDTGLPYASTHSQLLCFHHKHQLDQAHRPSLSHFLSSNDLPFSSTQPVPPSFLWFSCVQFLKALFVTYFNESRAEHATTPWKKGNPSCPAYISSLIIVRVIGSTDGEGRGGGER